MGRSQASSDPSSPRDSWFFWKDLNRCGLRYVERLPTPVPPPFFQGSFIGFLYVFLKNNNNNKFLFSLLFFSRTESCTPTATVQPPFTVSLDDDGLGHPRLGLLPPRASCLSFRKTDGCLVARSERGFESLGDAADGMRVGSETQVSRRTLVYVLWFCL